MAPLSYSLFLCCSMDVHGRSFHRFLDIVSGKTNLLGFPFQGNEMVIIRDSVGDKSDTNNNEDVIR